MGEAEARALRSLVKVRGPVMPAMAVEYHGRRYSWTGDPDDMITVERQARYEDADEAMPGWAWVSTGERLSPPSHRTVTSFLARIGR